MFNFKCLIKNVKIIRRNFCELSKGVIKKEEGNKMINVENMNNLQNLESENSETAKKLQKLGRIMPLDKVDQSVLNDVIKYKVLEDSLPAAVEEMKADVPEVSKHVEFREWVKDVIEQGKQEEVLNKEGIVILKNKTDVFHKYGIDTHNYRKFHDRDYELDIKELLTKDLYEKQRVVDQFVEDNKTQINNLIGFYANRFKCMNLNKHAYLIYRNNYDKFLNKIRNNLLSNIFSTSILSFSFYLLNPLFMLLLIPEYFSILYTSFILNNLVEQIILTETKQTIVLHKYNFLGYKKELKYKGVNLANIFYQGKIQNNVLNMDDKGVFFITRLIRRYFRNKKNKPSENTAQFDNFKYFHTIRTTGKAFYIPADCSTQHEDTNEELIVAIINNNLKFILEYDYSNFENRMEDFIKQMDEFNKVFSKKVHDNSYYSEEQKLKDKYSKYENNRDYSDDKYELTLRRTDGADGTYINNGYR